MMNSQSVNKSVVKFINSTSTVGTGIIGGSVKKNLNNEN